MLTLLFAAPAAANHVRCGDTIAQDTTLDSDLTCDGNGLIVRKGGVRLDLNGHTISGSGDRFTYGIYIPGSLAGEFVTDVKVMNGVITGFGAAGIRAEDASGPSVTRMVLDSNGTGFSCSATTKCRIENSLVRANRVGVFLGDSFTDNPEGSIVTRNVFVGNGSTTDPPYRPALYISGHQATVTTNLFLRNLAEGIVVTESIHGVVTLARNVVAGNDREGIFVVFQAQATIENSRIEHNGGDGVRVDDAHADLYRNRISGNAKDGILVNRPRGPARGMEVRGNRTDRNGDDGIDVDSLNFGSVTLGSNRAFFNADLGVEAVPTTTDGGGNRAKHNGNPAQCVGVSCK